MSTMTKGLWKGALLGAAFFALTAATPWNANQLIEQGFRCRMSSETTDKDGTVQSAMEARMAAYKQRMRMEIEPAKIQGGKDDKGRRQAPPAMNNMIILRDNEKKVTDMVFPQSKMYVEMLDSKKKGSMDRTPKQAWFNTDVSLEELGAETVDGHPCRKVKATWKDPSDKDEKQFSSTLWLAKDLHDFPVQARDDQDEDHVTTVHYHDIVLGNVAASQFEVPAGYEKGSMFDVVKAGMRNGNGEQKKDGDGDEAQASGDDEKGKDKDKDKADDSGGLGKFLKKKLRK